MAQGRKPGSVRAGPVRALPWWLAGDDEECAHCGQGYAYETEVICAECDEPLCPLCAAHVERRMLCPACAGEGG